jgi:hypothetical protein
MRVVRFLSVARMIMSGVRVNSFSAIGMTAFDRPVNRFVENIIPKIAD